MRWRSTLLVLTVLMLAMLTGGVLSRASSGPAPASSSTSVAGAVRALTDGRAAAARSLVPADFEEVMGYRPLVRRGRLVDLEGSCSSVVPLPGAFTPVCAEHDFGYDLLRYADRRDLTLPGWARPAIDARMAAQLRQVCVAELTGSARLRCLSAAGTASAAVRLNSVRQGDGVPEESAAGLLGSLAVAFSGLSLLAFGRAAWS
ncbi:MAG: hypothetical protein ACOYX5_08635 [Actinomycetota bacterium]